MIILNNQKFIKLLFLLITILTFFVKTKAQINNKSLITVGDHAPTIKGTDQFGNFFDSREALNNGPVLLIFYRGAWCSVCKKHLSAVQDSLQLLLDKGVSVVVVTPEKSESIQKMVNKTNATFSIIYDEEYKIMDAFGVSFIISKETVPRHYSFVLNSTRESNENNDDILPVPATYLICENGIVKYLHYDPDYRNRSKVSTILSYLD